MNEPQRSPAHPQVMVQTYLPIEQLVPTLWSEGEILTNGIRQHYYRTGGQKPPLLLLHGFNEYGLTWLRTAKELAEDYDIIMPDARGHGRSDSIANGFSSSLLVDDVVALIHGLALGRPRIIGLSQGGSTGLQLAATYPELVHSFIFEGWGDEREHSANTESFAQSEAYQAWFNSWLLQLEELRALSHQQRMVVALSLLMPTMGGTLWPEDEYVPSVEGYALLDLALTRYSINLWNSKDMDDPVELLQRVKCPALIMKHAWSFPAPGMPVTVREVPSAQPNVRIVYFENTGHLIRRMAFDQYMTLVREFLGAH